MRGVFKEGVERDQNGSTKEKEKEIKGRKYQYNMEITN